MLNKEEIENLRWVASSNRKNIDTSKLVKTFPLEEVNDQLRCMTTLKTLNDIINGLWKLSDTDHYLDWIWNSSSNVTDMIADLGIDNPNYYSDLACQFEKIRAIIVGDTLDYNKLYQDMYDSILSQAIVECERGEKFNEELRRRIRKLESEKK